MSPTCLSRPSLPSPRFGFSRSKPECLENLHGRRVPPSPICSIHRRIVPISRYIAHLTMMSLLTVGIRWEMLRSPVTVTAETGVKNKDHGCWQWVYKRQLTRLRWGVYPPGSAWDQGGSQREPSSS